MGENSNAEIVDELRHLVAQIIHLDPDTMEAGQSLRDYGITSIELIDFIRRIERRYSISFQPDALKEITLNALAENVHLAMNGEMQ